MAAPLSGIRIVDLTQMVSGPMATQILADQGADVIKVEPPGTGDLTRALGGRRRGLAPLFATTNRNKRSVAIDLKQPRGLRLLEALVATADVFVENFRPGTAERLGVGAEALGRIRPDLVHVSINGFGESGPYVGKRVYDPVVQALSGLAAIQADASGRPRMMRLIVPDKVTALTAAQAITAALLARARSGEGQRVRLAMLDAVIAFLWPEGMAAQTFVDEESAPVRPPLTRDLVFETRDGFITVGAVSDIEWEGLVRALEHPEWLVDPRFRTPAGRVRHADARLELTAQALRTRRSGDWLERLDAAGVPCAPILTREEVLRDPQVKANGLVRESVHPHAGPMRQPRAAARFDGAPWELRRAAPLLGEHTEEVLAELGIGRRAAADLRAAGVIGSPPPSAGGSAGGSAR